MFLNRRWVFCSLVALLTGVCFATNLDPYVEATKGVHPIIGKTYFGIHFHRLVPEPPNRVGTPWPDAPLVFGDIRLWDTGTRWADLAPKPGQWEFERLDHFVSIAETNQAEVVYVFGSTPRWASERPDEPCPYGLGCAAAPVKLAHWEEYVRRVVTRYRGRIHAYELWNEPFFSEVKPTKGPSDFYYGPVAKMVEMARIARKIIDEFDPGAILITPGFTGDTKQLDLFLQEGGKQYVQVVAYHFYSANGAEFVKTVNDVRAVMRRHSIDGLPLWNTESGVQIWPEGMHTPLSIKDRQDAEKAGAQTAQMLILGAAVHLERFYHYAWDSETYGMVTRTGDRLPRYAAMARVQSWLIGARMSGCAEQATDVVTCGGDREGKRFLIVWANSEGTRTIKLPAGTTAIRAEPLYPDAPDPNIVTRRGTVSLVVGQEPVRIVLVDSSAS